MTQTHKAKYEVIAVVHTERNGGRVTKQLDLLYVGDGTKWEDTSASHKFVVPNDFEAHPGNIVEVSIEVQK